MKILLTILFFSISYAYSQAQIKYVKGISIYGKDAIYTATALPMTTTVQTSLRNKADSLKALYTRVISLEKRNKILTDSNTILKKVIQDIQIPDTVKILNTNVRQVRKHYQEVEILK